MNIPIVTLLLEGGKDAIRIVKDRLKEGISCVVIEGSGRAADIIGYAYKNAVKDIIKCVTHSSSLPKYDPLRIAITKPSDHSIYS